MDDPEAGYTLKPGFVSGNLRVNSLGFRGPEISREKPPGTYRIVSLGDSATFGPQEEECAYPYLLPALLQPRQVEAVNAAVEGYRTDRALARLRKDVLPLKPDLVTVFIGWNDLYQTDPGAETEQLSIRGNPLAQLLTLSEAAQTFRRVYFMRAQSARGVGPSIGERTLQPYAPSGYAERLREIFRTVRVGGADVITLTWPTVLSDQMSPEAQAKAHYPWYTAQSTELLALYRKYQETLRRVAAEERVPVVDVAALFVGPNRAALFKDTAHFTCEGQSMVAAELARQLQAGVVTSFKASS